MLLLERSPWADTAVRAEEVPVFVTSKWGIVHPHIAAHTAHSARSNITAIEPKGRDSDGTGSLIMTRLRNITVIGRACACAWFF